MRLLVILLMLLTLPAYGLAATGHAGGCQLRMGAGAAPHSPDAMDMAGMDLTALAGVSMNGADVHQVCCPGSGNTQPPGKQSGCPACLAAQGCKGAPDAQLPSPQLMTLLLLHSGVMQQSSPLPSQCGPDALLRPPTVS
jgi:hypothetical protein